MDETNQHNIDIPDDLFNMTSVAVAEPLKAKVGLVMTVG